MILLKNVSKSYKKKIILEKGKGVNERAAYF